MCERRSQQGGWHWLQLRCVGGPNALRDMSVRLRGSAARWEGKSRRGGPLQGGG